MNRITIFNILIGYSNVRLYFIFQTFFAIGFGDIEMVTYCGRSVAIITGIVVRSSALFKLTRFYEYL